MKKLILAAVLMGMAGVASAAGETCEAQADSKKLNGAARTSFVKKCVATSGASACATQADGKKLYGAARNSFIKKCERG